MDLCITSSAFDEGQPIPARYTCDDADHSPPLRIEGVPHDAQSLVLLVDDPDAGDEPWVHWLLFDMPTDTVLLVESPQMERVGAKVGKNTWGKAAYGGPCPPSGTHTYRFQLFAVDYVTGLEDGASWPEVWEAIDGHIVAQAELTGTYEKEHH